MPTLIHLTQIQDGMTIKNDVEKINNTLNNEEDGLVKKVSNAESVNEEQNQRLEELEKNQDEASMKWEKF